MNFPPTGNPFPKIAKSQGSLEDENLIYNLPLRFGVSAQGGISGRFSLYSEGVRILKGDTIYKTWSILCQEFTGGHAIHSHVLFFFQTHCVIFAKFVLIFHLVPSGRGLLCLPAYACVSRHFQPTNSSTHRQCTCPR